MIKKFLKVAFRNLLRNKGFSIINISGLAIGMGSAILILLWIQNELSYDTFHKNRANLYQAWNKSSFEGTIHAWGTTPKILGKTLKMEYPEVEEAVRYSSGISNLFAVGDNKLMATGSFTDPGYLQIFSFPLLQGNAATALNGTYNIILTEKLAKKIFGNKNPMGKIVTLENKSNFTVTGVMKDLPNNTTFDFEYLLPWTYMHSLGWDDDSWGNNSVQTYVLLKPATNLAAFSAKILNVTKQHSKGEEDIDVFLHPISKWRLYSRFENGVSIGGRIEVVRLFAFIAAFILLIACINFMNLSTARSEKRAKEVGIRKTVGAQKSSLVSQFLGESVLLALVAGLLALLLVQLFLPSFNNLTEKRLSIEWSSPGFWLTGLLFILLTGIVAGSYPAFFLSSFRPVKVLKGTFKASNALITPRKVLVILQFTFAVILIICTMIVTQQIRHARDRSTGYVRENLVYHLLTGDMEKNYPLIREALLNSGIAASVTKTSAPVTEGWSDSWGYEWEGKNPTSRIDFDNYNADGHLVKTMGLQLVMGRDINLEEYPTDSTACLLNESAKEIMGFKDPIGRIIKYNDIDWHVVGVIKDFILRSPYHPMRPMVISGAKGWFNVLHVRLNAAHSIAENLSGMEKILKRYNPQYPFEYHFADEEYARKFNDEKRTATLAALFAGLSIFISCLGLFGLATYMAENRLKEIGVRKVLGASVTDITTLLSKDFLKLVTFSILIATPVAWYAMHRWLQDYPYHVNIQWWIFISAGFVAILIALLTVSYQSIRAALSNPVKNLRTE